MKQLTPPRCRYFGLTVTLSAILITLPDGLVNRVSSQRSPQEFRQIGPNSRVVVHNLPGTLNRFKNYGSEDFVRHGIREVMKDKYRKRYQAWKNEFLSTETGRSQWERYANASTFLLTITVADDPPHDARTDHYEWNSSGSLDAVTIFLGCRLDEGYPAAGSYPVIGSLATNVKYATRKNILAASKLAHELGHVDQALANSEFQRQKQLIHAYLTILQTKGHDRHDPRLTDLAQQLGGPPIQIWSGWECRAEANALLYLRDKVSQQQLPPSLLETIARNVTLSTNGCAKSFVPELLVKSRKGI